VRLELQAFLGAEVEGRMRARPRFLRRTPRDLLVELRRELDDDVHRAADDALRAAGDLRAFFGGAGRTVAEEHQALVVVVEERAVALARAILRTSFFPGDDVGDGPDSDVVDAAPRFALRFVPSPALAWAWATVRELDRVRAAVAAARGGPVADGYELRRHLPEALPAQAW
jgi:hypothetical protein